MQCCVFNLGFYSKFNTESSVEREAVERSPPKALGASLDAAKKMQISRMLEKKNSENSGGEASCGAGEGGKGVD